MESVEFPYAAISWNEPVMTIVFKEGAELDVPEIRELIIVTEKLAGKKPYLLLSDAKVFIDVTPEARQIMADKKEVPFLVANAVLINNLPVRLTANFFARFNKPPFKFKVFRTEKKAMAWLLKFDPRKS